MRHNLTIRERMLRAFAAVVKTVFPTWAVKSFTIKEKRQGYGITLGYDYEAKARLFLPGAKKELKAIKKLKLDENGLCERIWSPETEMTLLKEGNYALVSRIKSNNAQALDIICATNNAELIAKVFTNSTPSATYLGAWLQKAPKETVLAVIDLAPTAFGDLKYADLTYDDDTTYLYMKALVECAEGYDDKKREKVAQHWAEETIKRDVIMEWYNVVDIRKDLLDSAMKVLVDADYDFTQYLKKLERYHDKWYATIRDNAMSSRHIASYLIERLPEVWFRLDTEKSTRLSQRYGENLSKADEGMAWMTMLSYKFNEPRVAIAALKICTYLTYWKPGAVVEQLQAALVRDICGFYAIELALSKLPEKFKSALQAKLFKAITTADEAKKAMKLLPKSYKKGVRAKLVEKTVESDAKILLSYWPFNGWEAETAEKAVRKLAEEKKLPLTKLEELPEELRAAAIEELEILSEISAIGRAYYGDLQKELMKQKFHARSESYLFQLDYNWQELKQLYITYNEMDEKSFKVLVNFRGTGYGGDEGKIGDLIRLHANTWGLTEKEYNALMQSPYSPLAADLKKTCKSEVVSEAEPIAVEAPDEAEILKND